MKIHKTQYEEAYRCARLVHAAEMRFIDALKLLTATGLNRNSAGDYVYNLRHMLNGHRYARTLSTEATSDYLIWIERDYGQKALKNAVFALKQHISYYQSLRKTPMRGTVAVLQRYIDLLKENTETFVSPEEVKQFQKYLEGRVKTVTVNVYERNVSARNACLEAHGYNCCVCDFDFEKTFGAIGKGFIHVHHLRDLASIAKEYEINPKEDLRPVCPNCHAMLHMSTPPYPIEELKKLIAAQ
jgi:5-methylcytosine-specific restriction protein A